MRRITRRTALRRIGIVAIPVVAGGGIAAAGTPAASAAPASRMTGLVETPPPWALFGTVVSATEHEMTIKEKLTGKHVSITQAPHTLMYSGASGRVRTMKAFLPGDTVAASGTNSSGTPVVDRVGSVLRNVAVNVHSIDGQIAKADIGPLRIDGALPDKNSNRVSVGTNGGLLWRNPTTETLYFMVP